jgi:hypothetical protein
MILYNTILNIEEFSFEDLNKIICNYVC